MEMWSTAHFPATAVKTNVSNSSQIDSAKHLIVGSSDSQYPCLPCDLLGASFFQVRERTRKGGLRHCARADWNPAFQDVASRNQGKGGVCLMMRSAIWMRIFLQRLSGQMLPLSGLWILALAISSSTAQAQVVFSP